MRRLDLLDTLLKYRPQVDTSHYHVVTGFTWERLQYMHSMGTQDASVSFIDPSLITFPLTDLEYSMINVALSSDFAMSALLALSASNLAWQTKNADTENLAYHHRGVALKGLHEAIGAFSERNSEAILAASVMLSWQATEW